MRIRPPSTPERSATARRRGAEGWSSCSRTTRDTTRSWPSGAPPTPQVGFSPDGRHLLVTTKSKNTIEVFAVAHDGRLSAKPATTMSTGDVPFSFVFDQAGHLLVTEAAKSGVTSYTLRKDGTLDVITPSVESGQQVLCWIARAGKFFYGTNPGSSTISLYTVDGNGKVSIGGKNGVIAAGGPEAVAEVAAAAADQDPDDEPAKAQPAPDSQHLCPAPIPAHGRPCNRMGSQSETTRPERPASSP